MICMILEFIANIFIGFFKILFSPVTLKVLVIVPIYVFVQRVHNQTQQRSLKAISDELVKVNDFLIEFIIKISLIEKEVEVDEKLISELSILKSKINAHIIYMNEYLNAFPYGGPVNYLFHFIFKVYLSEKEKEMSDSLDMQYQELILNDTILSLEKKFIDKKKLVKLDSNTIDLNQKTIDKVISVSRNLLEHLEMNTRKMF
ncbi:hypothetical protein ACSFV5_07375 [Acinetobacter sp. HC8-3S]|uniref:Uncharacterized protein n=2 Tax=Acinetobacter venetianus TaxID=52133 RepID=N8YJG9_ACIVR|nr:hypothetical protein F959_01658 [Acinetobacter venetianus RAG-1 = CIP 110063]RZG78743.1 hypothetical protein EXE23_15245 [Acinetobacter venetianus]